MHCITIGCVAKINDSMLLYSGTVVAPVQYTVTFMYDVELNTWTKMSNLSDVHTSLGCGSVDPQVGFKACNSKHSFCHHCLFDPSIRTDRDIERSSLQEVQIHHTILSRNTILLKTHGHLAMTYHLDCPERIVFHIGTHSSWSVES